MKKIYLFIAVLTITFPGFTQSLTHSGGSIIPKGTWVDIYLNGGTSSCTPTVPYQSRWSISPSPSDITYYEQPTGNYSHIRAKWDSYADVRITVSYSCAQNGSISPITTDATLFTVNDVIPSFSVKITGGMESYYCQSTNVILEPINMTNQGTSPTYYWCVDDPDSPVRYSGSPAPFLVSLGPGSHRVFMKMMSSITGTTVQSTNNLVINVTPKTMGLLVATMYVNGAICPGNPVAKASVNVTGGASPYRYRWYRNGSNVITTEDGKDGNGLPTSQPQNHYDYTNVKQGDILYCKVESVNTSPVGCTEPPTTKDYTVDIDGVNPTVSITTLNTNLCEGLPVTFSSSKAGTDYTWRLIHNGSIRRTSKEKTFTLTATSNKNSRDDFNPDSQITLSVDGLASSGCSGNSYSASTQRNASTFDFWPRPTAAITPTGKVVFCTTCVPVLQASVSSGYSYGWMRDNSFIPNENGPTLTTDIEGPYMVQVSSPFCYSNSEITTLKRNTLPTVSAGPDKRVALPLSSLSIEGTGSDEDGPVAFTWEQIDDPNSPGITLSGTNTSTLVLTDLFVGVYRFRLKGTDNTNESRYDEVKIIIDPPNNYNYVKENIVNIPGVANYNEVASLPIGSRNETVTYVDGLGRQMQVVSTQTSPYPLKKDIIQPMQYDEYGREVKKFLPNVSDETNGWFKVNQLGSAGSYTTSPHYQFYQNGEGDKIKDDIRPFAESILESSPLNRPDKQYGPGVEWYNKNKYVQHKSLINEDGTNTGQEKIIHWVMTTTGDLSISAVNNGYYPTGVLSITSTTDENGNEVREYTDRYNHMICRKMRSGETSPAPLFAFTYYIYDDLGNLVTVLQPEGVEKLKSSLNLN